MQGRYRVLPVADDEGRTWLVTPDDKFVAPFKKAIIDPKPSLLLGVLSGGTKVVDVVRVGRAKARWPLAKDA